MSGAAKTKPTKRAKSTQETPPVQIPPDTVNRAALIAFGVSVATILMVRARLLGVPLERDEGEYAYAGKLILDGVAPFVEAYNMKMPGIYAAYAAVMALFGETAVGIHLGLMLVNLACIVFVFLLARRYFDLATAAIAAASYGWLTLGSGILGFFAHATHFVAFFGLAGFLVLMRPNALPRWPHGLAAGLLFGCAFMMKQHGAPFIVVAGVYLLARLWQAREAPMTQRALPLALFSAGVFAPFLLTCAIMWKAGVFDTFWFWTFDYARAYVGQSSYNHFVANLQFATLQLVPPAMLMFGLAAVGIVDTIVKRRYVAFLGGAWVAAVMAVSPGFYFRHHYFVLMMPVMAVSVALGAHTLASRLPGNLRNAPALGAVFVAAAAWAQYAIADRANLFFNDAAEVSRRLYHPNPFPESPEIARYLREHTEPDDRIAVLGSEPQLYFYADRRAATGYLYTYPLMEAQRFAAQMQEQMQQEIEEARPKYIVFVSISTSWLREKESPDNILMWLGKYLETHYVREGLIEITPVGTRYLWQRDQQNRGPVVKDWVGVFRRKDAGTPTT